MTDRPILFSAPMVRALLAGTKTQTRRIARLPEPSAPILDFVKVGTDTAGRNVYEMKDKRGSHVTIRAGKHSLEYCFTAPIAVGDRLWVRESFLPDPPNGHRAWDDHTCSFVEWSGCGEKIADVPPQLQNSEECIFAADPKWIGFCMTWRPGIHMPRWASRLTLLVTDVRIEKLQDISEADAIAEGIEPVYDERSPGQTLWKDYECYPDKTPHAHAIVPFVLPSRSYCSLWEEINGHGSWIDNPWVVAYTFKVIAGNIDKINRQADG